MFNTLHTDRVIPRGWPDAAPFFQAKDSSEDADVTGQPARSVAGKLTATNAHLGACYS